MPNDGIDEFARRWIADWNSHDLEAILRHYAPTAEFRSPVARQLTGDGRVLGQAGLRSYWRRGLDLNPALHFTLLDVLPGDACATLLYRNDRGQTVAETHEFDTDGRVVRAYACYSAARTSTT